MADPDELTEAAAPSRPTRAFSDETALFALRALTGPFLPWGSGAMRPAGLVAVCNDIVLGDRRRIVELGSGVSTVMLARLLGQLADPTDRRLIAVEHDPTWRRWVLRQLESEGLGDRVDVLDAPLRRDGGDLPWYDEDVLAGAIDTVDLLVVDGPPAYEPGLGLARHRALPVLRHRLSAGATVVLDDIERPGEQEVLRRWEADLGLTFRRDDAAGIAVATVA